MARELKLNTEITGLVPVVAGLDKMASAVDEVGDQAKQTERELSRLSRQITETEAKMALLTKSFNETGDSKFVKEFGKEKKTLAGLQAMNKELDKTEASAKKATRALEGIVPGGGNNKGITGQLRIPGLDLLSSLGPEGLAGIAAGAVPLSTTAGGLLAAGGLLTAGLAGVGGGIAIAAQRKQVKDAFSSLFVEVAADMRRDADVFVEPLHRSADIFGEAFRRQEPGIKRVFAELAQDVEPLAAGLSGLVEKMLPGIEKAAIAAKPVLDAFSADFLPTIGQGIGDLFDKISDPSSVQGAVDALKDFGDGIKVILDGSGDAIQVLSELNHAFHELDTLGGRLPSSLQFAAAGMDIMSGGTKFLVDEFANLTGVLDGTHQPLGETNQLVREGAPQFDALGRAVNETAGEYHGLFWEAEQAAKGIKDASNAAADNLSNALDLSNATLQLQDDFHALKKQIDENGASFADNTEAGEANHRSLNQIIEDMLRQRSAAIAAAGGTAQATQDADAALKAQFAMLRAWAVNLGVPRAQIDAILNAYLKLLNAPNITKSVRISSAGAGATTGGGFHAFAEGGPVDQVPPGKPMLAVVHGGEYVIPRGGTRIASSRGGSSATPVLQYAGGSMAGFEGVFYSMLQHALRTGKIVVTQKMVQN